MEEPDRGQGKVVIERTNGKQEKTVAVEVYILDQGIYLAFKTTLQLSCECEVQTNYVVHTLESVISHRSQFPAMLAAWQVVIPCRTLPHWERGCTMPSFALHMEPQPSLSATSLPWGLYGPLHIAFSDKLLCPEPRL